MGFFAKVFGSKEAAEYKVRNAGPGVPIDTRISVYVGPPRDMPLDQLVARRKRLAEVIPQYEVKPDVIVRKQAARYRAALAGEQGSKAKAAAEWLMADLRDRAESKITELKARLRIYDERIKAAMADAGVK
jgi:hypothetical protein